MSYFEPEDKELTAARHRYEIAQARMGVAEQFAWPVAVLSGMYVWGAFSPWLAPVAFLGSMWLAILPYKRPYKDAERAFEAECQRSLR